MACDMHVLQWSDLAQTLGREYGLQAKSSDSPEWPQVQGRESQRAVAGCQSSPIGQKMSKTTGMCTPDGKGSTSELLNFTVL
jgi:hypothetical protein